MAAPLPPGQIGDPLGLATDSAGSIYIADTINHRIPRIAAPAITAPVNAASFEAMALAPNSYGTIFSANLATVTSLLQQSLFRLQSRA